MTSHGCQDVSTPGPAAAEQEAATSKDVWVDNMIMLADRTTLMLGGGKASACYCAGQIRWNKSPVPSPPVAPRRMQQSCSSMTCHKHEGKHTRTYTYTHYSREAGVAFTASGNLLNNNN